MKEKPFQYAVYRYTEPLKPHPDNMHMVFGPVTLDRAIDYVFDAFRPEWYMIKAEVN